MFIAQIDFKIIKKFDIEEQSDSIISLLATLYLEGRVLDQNPSVFPIKNFLRTFVSIPDKEAFNNLDTHKYIAQNLDKLSEVSLSQPIFQILGEDIETPESCKCVESSAYILFTHFLSMQPPIKCLDCLEPVPLYKIPQKEPQQLKRAIGWQSEYKACDLLQMHCGFGERFGVKQLSKLDSGLSETGLEICQEISQLTQKPCYYYLYKYSGKSLKKELERKCPKCNNEWILEKSFHIFDFKCDKCHLLSNIAFDLR